MVGAGSRAPMRRRSPLRSWSAACFLPGCWQQRRWRCRCRPFGSRPSSSGSSGEARRTTVAPAAAPAVARTAQGRTVGTLRIRRTPQCGQVLALQRPRRRRRPRGAVCLRDGRPQRRGGQGARRSSGEARRDEQLEVGHPRERPVRRHRRAGRGRGAGRGAGQPVPGPHPRGRRDRLRPAGLRRHRRARLVGPGGAALDARGRAGLLRPGDAGEAVREAPQGGAGRQVARR